MRLEYHYLYEREENLFTLPVACVIDGIAHDSEGPLVVVRHPEAKCSFDLEHAWFRFRWVRFGDYVSPLWAYIGYDDKLGALYRVPA